MTTKTDVYEYVEPDIAVPPTGKPYKNPRVGDRWMRLNSRDEEGRVRREFLCACVAATVVSSDIVDPQNAWTFAELLLAEGQKRGYLP